MVGSVLTWRRYRCFILFIILLIAASRWHTVASRRQVTAKAGIICFGGKCRAKDGVLVHFMYRARTEHVGQWQSWRVHLTRGRPRVEWMLRWAWDQENPQRTRMCSTRMWMMIQSHHSDSIYGPSLWHQQIIKITYIIAIDEFCSKEFATVGTLDRWILRVIIYCSAW
jgi:hypothetical protein